MAAISSERLEVHSDKSNGLLIWGGDSKEDVSGLLACEY